MSKTRQEMQIDLLHKLHTIDPESERTIGELITERFLKYYCFDNGFGKAGKRNTDVFLISLLHEYGLINMDTAMDVYRSAATLMIKETQLRNLFHDARILYSNSPDDAQKKSALIELAFENCPKSGSAGASIIQFEVIDPLMKDYLLASAATCKGWSDTSFNSRIVKMPVSVFAEILVNEFWPEGETDEFHVACTILNKYAEQFNDNDFQPRVRTALMNASSREDLTKAISKQIEGRDESPERCESFAEAIGLADSATSLVAAGLCLIKLIAGC